MGSSKELSEEIKSYDLVKFAKELFTGEKYVNDLPWIVNLDLDYFYSAAPEKLVLYSEEYILALAEALKSGLKNGMIEILTVSLSPECCGSWEKAESMLGYFSSCRFK